MDERSDTELLLASRAEPVAFVELYRRHAEDLLRYFARRTLDPEAAAELMSETFAEAYASRGNYRDTGANGVAWLYGIAQHQLSRFFRTGRLSAMARGEIGINREELPADDYERIEELVDLAPIREALIEALGTLAEEQRDALQLRVIDGLGYAQVAERLGCAEAAARQRVSRGLRRIALVLQERGPEPRDGGGVGGHRVRDPPPLRDPAGAGRGARQAPGGEPAAEAEPASTGGRRSALPRRCSALSFVVGLLATGGSVLGGGSAAAPASSAAGRLRARGSSAPGSLFRPGAGRPSNVPRGAPGAAHLGVKAPAPKLRSRSIKAPRRAPALAHD